MQIQERLDFTQLTECSDNIWSEYERIKWLTAQAWNEYNKYPENDLSLQKANIYNIYKKYREIEAKLCALVYAIPALLDEI